MPAGRTVRLVAALALLVLAGSPAHSQVARRPTGEKYALLVGVREYDPNVLRRLRYSEPDVVELSRLLKDAGYQRVHLMTHGEGAANFRHLPTAANIRTSLKGILEGRDPADTVLVALAGHGIQFPGETESYFCPMDANLRDRSTLISLDEIYRTLEKCPAGVKLLFADCCRNDPLSDIARSRVTVAVESVSRPQVKLPPGGVGAMFSCSPGEKAFESQSLGHGVFFSYLIQGLRGKADFGGDGVIDMDELAMFVKRRVPDHVKDEYGDNVTQVPVYRGEVRGQPAIVDLKVLNAKPSLYVLAVGIDAYTEGPPLAYCVSDAEALGRVLGEKTRSLFDRVEVRKLTDRAATTDNVLKGLAWLRERTTHKDVGLFAFAGREGKPKDGSYALMTVDSGYEDAVSRGISTEVMERALAGTQGRLLFLLDTCKSGAMAAHLADALPRAAALASSRADEVTFEDKKYGAGLMTHAVKEALAGRADSDQDGVVSVGELGDYVGGRVQTLARDIQQVQHPEFRKSPSYEDFPLVKP